MPAYTLREYSLHWTLTPPDGSKIFSEGDLDLPTLVPASEWSGDILFNIPAEKYILTLRVMRPTGYSVIEHSYDAEGKLIR
jgi:hypothetical protein